MKGGRPTPTVLKMLRGNPGKRALNRLEPQPGELSEDLPDCLQSDESRAEWARTIVPAIQIGQVTETDRALAIAHCELWGEWRDEVAEARKVEGPSAARSMAAKTLNLLVKVDAELGLSPASRSRVRAIPKQPANPLDKFTSRRRA